VLASEALVHLVIPNRDHLQGLEPGSGHEVWVGGFSWSPSAPGIGCAEFLRMVSTACPEYCDFQLYVDLKNSSSAWVSGI